jgi:hypothetical protein
MSELATLKTIPVRYKMMNHHKDVLMKYNIPAIYALWEGYVRNSFSLYGGVINSLNLTHCEVHLNVLTHALLSDDKLNLENPRRTFEKKKDFIAHYQATARCPLNIGEKLPLKSNVDYDVINDMLTRFNLALLPKEYKKQLGKLLKYRNSIAHGEVSLPIKQDFLSDFSMLVNDLMIMIYERIETGYNNKTFLSRP